MYRFVNVSWLYANVWKHCAKNELRLPIDYVMNFFIECMLLIYFLVTWFCRCKLCNRKYSSHFTHCSSAMLDGIEKKKVAQSVLENTRNIFLVVSLEDEPDAKAARLTHDQVRAPASINIRWTTSVERSPMAHGELRFTSIFLCD